LKDVAKSAGVSPSTVSAALNNGDSRYNAETVERIRAIAAKLGYRPNRSAQSIRTGKNKLIGMIYFGGTLQVANERAHYIGRAVEERGYELLTLDVHWYDGRLAKVVNRLLEAGVSGIIIAGPGAAAEDILPFQERAIPIVGIASNETGLFPLVRADMRQGMQEITRHLLSLGHRKILNLSMADPAQREEEIPWQQRQQLSGVRDVILEAGGSHSIGLAEQCLDWLARDHPGITSFTLCEPSEIIYFDPFVFSRRAIRSIKGAASLPDAIICQNDEWAVGAISELATQGIRVPDDLAITGYNDSALAANFPVPLTSVRQPIPAMARKTVEWCIAAMENRAQPSQGCAIFDLPCELVVRESCQRRAARTH